MGRHGLADADETAAPSLWDRIRHRKVVQWSLAYLAAAWGLVQVVEFAVVTFQWPEAVTRVAAVVASVGLPVTVVLAWFHGDRGQQRVVRVELLVLAALLLGGGLLVRQVAVESPAQKDVAEQRQAAGAARADRRRLAVLPFANLGDDPANAAFVGGVHDTLITQIAKVPGLTVISRSSVLQFEGRKPTIAEVAAALNVGAVLEGSVQRDGQRLRIQAQLIDASSDAHLWAETFDRNAGDLFAVQSEIAQAVAEQLRVHLAGGDSERLTAAPTTNPQAYEHYAVGRSLMSRSFDGTDHDEEAISEFVVAVTLDPNFAAAHAQLSIARTWRVFKNPQLRKDVLPLAKASAERALAIDPTLPEGHLAKAVYLYRGEPDLPGAATEFETAIAGLPNDALAHQNFGYLRAYQGRFEEAAALFARATQLDPRGGGFTPLINTLAILGRRGDAFAAVARARAAQPENVEFRLRGGTLAFDCDCDLHAWQSTLDAVPPQLADDWQVLRERWFFALTSGNYPQAIEYAGRMARANPEEDYSDQLGWTYAFAGRKVDAEAQYRVVLQRGLRDLQNMPPGDAAAQSMAFLARAYAYIGDRADAIKYANRAIAALPPSGAFRQRPVVLLMSAGALAYAGEIAAARELYRQLLEQSFEIKPRGLWCDPVSAPMRADPAFRAMLAEHGADVSVDPHRRDTWPKPAASQPGT
jgi:TolB-like protein/Tfp pilus assembly protein PilF